MARRGWVQGFVVSAMVIWPAAGWAAEHGGQEHGGATSAPAAKEHGGATQEHGGQVAQAEPSAEQIRQAIRDYIAKTEKERGAFTIQDTATGATRTLSLIQVHDRVGKTGELYYSCTDMKETSTGETLDLDFDVDAKAGELTVVDVRIHKVNGQPRYTYDDKDNRVPLM